MAKLFLNIACLAILVLPLAVSAQGNASASNGIPTRITERASKAVKGVIARCAVIESNIQSKTSVFDNNKVRHLEIYANVKSKIAVLAEKLSAKGLNIETLSSYLSVFDQKIKKFNDDYAVYISKLKDSQAYVCGKSEGDFRTKLKEAKAALAQVHKDAVDIRVYYAQTLKPELNRLRNQLRPKSATTTEETAEAAVPSVSSDETVTTTTETN